MHLYLDKLQAETDTEWVACPLSDTSGSSWHELLDNMATVGTVVGILACLAYLLLPTCVIVGDCASVPNSHPHVLASVAMVPFTTASHPRVDG